MRLNEQNINFYHSQRFPSNPFLVRPKSRVIGNILIPIRCRITTLMGLSLSPQDKYRLYEFDRLL